MKEIKDFCKQIWRKLNENIWGKLIILFGITLIMGSIIIKVFEFNRTIGLTFSLTLIILLGYFTIMYCIEVLDKSNKK